MARTSLFRAGILMLALTLEGTRLARADMPEAANFGELERSGYVALDLLTTPLLYPITTGKPYDARTLVPEGWESLPADLRQRGRELNDRDEFKVHRALQAFQPYIESRITALCQSTRLPGERAPRPWAARFQSPPLCVDAAVEGCQATVERKPSLLGRLRQDPPYPADRLYRRHELERQASSLPVPRDRRHRAGTADQAKAGAGKAGFFS